MQDEEWMTEQIVQEASHREDLCIWPDGTACYRFELPHMAHMSDDYMCVEIGTDEYREICEAMGFA